MLLQTIARSLFFEYRQTEKYVLHLKPVKDVSFFHVTDIFI